MSRVIGYVKSFENGTFFVKDAKGKVHQLKAGEAIHSGELVYGAPNNSKDAKIIIDVTLQNAGDMVISGNGALVFDTSMLKDVFSHDDAVVYVNSVKDALAAKHLAKPGVETQSGEETAAGTEVATSEKEGDSFYDRDGSLVDVTTSLNGTNPVVNTVLSTDILNIIDTNEPVAPTVTLTTDSGTSNSDLITNSGVLIIGNIESGAIVEYSTDGVNWSNSFTPIEGSNTVYIRQTNTVGNTSASSTITFILDTQVAAPTVTLVNDTANGTDLITSDGTLSVTDVEAGAIVEYSINGTDWSSIFIAAEGSNTVYVRQTDMAGNVSGSTMITFTLDTSVAAPTITFESTGADSVYNKAEVGTDGTITATIGLPSDAVAGDLISIDGAAARAITAAEITAGKIVIEVAPGATVTAQITDQAGNPSSLASETAAGADLEALAPTITFESTGADSVYNKAEVGTDGTITATIGLPSDAVAGDLISIDGAAARAITAAEITAGKIVIEVAPGATVTAQITDQAGNPSSLASETAAGADLEALAPTITFESTGADSVYNKAEVGTDGTITATIGLPSDAVAGDLISIDGAAARAITAAEITAGKIVIEVAPGATVTAQITDQAGNPSSLASETAAGADLEALAPTITFESTGADSVYNKAEVGTDGTITATIGLPSDAVAGDLISIDGAAARAITAAEITAGKIVIEVAPGATVTAQITDQAGNPSSLASETAAGADLEALAPTITFESTGADSVYNKAEVGTDGTITATIGLPSDAVAGDLISIDGAAARAITAAEITAGKIVIEVAPGATVTAQITDQAGNPSSLASETAAGADLEALAPTITFESTGADSVYNKAYLYS